MRHSARSRSGSRWLRAALLLALLAGLAAAVTPVARAASGTVFIEISQAEAINKNSDVFPLAFWAVQQDFYPKLGVDGPLPPAALTQGPEIDQRDWATWAPFSVSKTFADLHDLGGSNIVHGVVELWDKDDIDSDDQFDINPVTGRTLPVDFDVCTLRFRRQSDTTEFTGPTWMRQGVESDSGRVRINMRTADGKPFLPNNVAIADATPVQAVYNPRYVIENKATAFKLDLTSSHSSPAGATINVQLNDGFTIVNDTKSVTIPPEGLRVFFFDGSGTAPPFSPRKQPNLRALRYTVTMNVPADSTSSDPTGLFPNCVATQDNTLTGSWPMITTNSPTTLYLGWDWGSSLIPGETITARPPSAAQVATTFASNERFRKAIFPIADTVSAPFPGFATSPKSTLEPAPTIMGWSIAAHAAGIDRLELIPRKSWFAENAGLLTFGGGAIGMSLAEFAPHAVLAEQGFSEVAVHEQGHTFRLSQRPCSTGGLAETLFGLGCRDEYTHAAGDGRPYLASGYDVLGAVFPGGAGGAAGTREVLNATNFMDTTGPLDGGPYDRWIDNLSYDWLSEQLRRPQDPDLISLSGFVQVPGGLAQSGSAPLVGGLFNSFQYAGAPDLPEATPGDQAGSGEGQFFVRLVTGQGARVYRFTPLFDLEGNSAHGYGFFSFAVPWDPATTSVELVGPATPADIAPKQGGGQQSVYATLTPSKAAPAVRTATRRPIS